MKTGRGVEHLWVVDNVNDLQVNKGAYTCQSIIMISLSNCYHEFDSYK